MTCYFLSQRKFNGKPISSHLKRDEETQAQGDVIIWFIEGSGLVPGHCDTGIKRAQWLNLLPHLSCGELENFKYFIVRLVGKTSSRLSWQMFKYKILQNLITWWKI